ELEQKLEARTRELAEALEQQAATSEILRVISSSPGELQPVFQGMLANAARLCEAKYGTLYLCEGDALRIVAAYNVPPGICRGAQPRPVPSSPEWYAGPGNANEADRPSCRPCGDPSLHRPRSGHPRRRRTRWRPHGSRHADAQE